MAQAAEDLNARKTEAELRAKQSSREVHSAFLNWLVWKVLLPLVLISSVYLLIRFILEIPHPFGKAFAHGDLLIFSALVLMEAATEGDRNRDQSFRMEALGLVAKLFAIAFIVGFVMTKGDLLLKEHKLAGLNDPAGHELLAKKMKAYSCLNCTVALLSVVGSVLLFWHNQANQRTTQRAGLAGWMQRAPHQKTAAPSGGAGD